jgi:hypothetical protein
MSSYFASNAARDQSTSGEAKTADTTSANQTLPKTKSSYPSAIACEGSFQEPTSYVSDSTLATPQIPCRRIYRGLSGIERQDSHVSVRQRRKAQIIHGYPQFARFIGTKKGYAIFRRFAALNARNLLYLQVELLELEDELDKIEEANSKDEDLRLIQFSTLHLRAYDDDHKGGQQYKIVMLLREKLKQYSRYCLPVNEACEG